MHIWKRITDAAGLAWLYIQREYVQGLEVVSIMSEMNEMDTTATKHKNEDFFSMNLDKDRKEKKNMQCLFRC